MRPIHIRDPLAHEADRIQRKISSDAVRLSWQPVIFFCGDTDVKAFQRAADWMQKEPGDKLIVLATWSAFIEEGEDAHYEVGLVLEG